MGKAKNPCFYFSVSFVNNISRDSVSVLGDGSLLSLSGWESRRNAKKM